MSQIKKQTPVRQSSANSTNNTSNLDVKKVRAQTTKTSSRNSVERDKEDKKIDRATSAKKRPLLTKEETIVQHVTPQSTKNYGVSTFLSNLNKNGMESTTPNG